MLEAAGFQTELTMFGLVDTASPALVDFSFTPAVIDTTSTAATVAVTVHLTDAGSGVCSFCSAVVRFQEAGTRQIRVTGPFTLTAGTVYNGIFSSQVTFPAGSAGGVWKVLDVLLRDRMGNSALWDETTLAAAGFPTGLTNTGVTDAAPPMLRNLSFTPAIIDTTSSGVSVTVTMHLTDPGAGVCPCGAVFFRFLHAGSGQVRDVMSFTLLSGTLTDGTFQGQATFFAGSAGGLWQLVYIQLVDQIGNEVTWSQAQLAAAGFPTDVINTASSGP